MADEKYVMVSIDDEKSKNIAEVLGNKTCRKILDILSDKNMTETDIANELKVPLNTIDYNIKKLIKSGLIEPVKNYFWSVKGKKMPVYTVSNKKIVISPRKRTIFNSILITAVLTGAIALFMKIFGFIGNGNIDNNLMSTGTEGAKLMAGVSSVAGYGADTAQNAFSSFNHNIIAYFSPWTWFLLGAWVSLIIFMVINLRRSK